MLHAIAVLKRRDLQPLLLRSNLDELRVSDVKAGTVRSHCSLIKIFRRINLNVLPLD